MKRTTTRAATVLGIAATISMGAASLGYADGSDEPTYQEYKAQTYQDPTDGQYIVNGDMPLKGEKQLRDFYQDLVNPQYENQLIVNTVYGKDDVWTATQAKNLTYCVSTKFGSDHGRVRDAMASGAAQWESASSGVNFTYVSSQDKSCTTRNNNVVFSVEPTNTTQYIARAFFPSTAKRSRNDRANGLSSPPSGCTIAALSSESWVQERSLKLSEPMLTHTSSMTQTLAWT